MKNEFKLESTEYLSRITNNYDKLSNSEKKIADYIINNKEEILNLSITSLSEKVGVGTATVTRFCYALGFKGFSEMKFYIEKKLLSPLGEKEEIYREDSIMTLKQKVFNFNKEVIDDTQEVLNDEELEKAINLISLANKVLIIGEGGSGASASMGYNLFLQIGLNCTYSTDAFLQVVNASQLNKDDVIIGIAHSGNIINTMDAFKVAKEQGAKTICITGNLKSSIGKISDIVLYTSSLSKPYLSDLPAARISEVCVIGLLQLGVLTRNYEKLSGNVKKSKKAYQLKRSE